MNDWQTVLGVTETDTPHAATTDSDTQNENGQPTPIVVTETVPVRPVLNGHPGWIPGGVDWIEALAAERGIYRRLAAALNSAGSRRDGNTSAVCKVIPDTEGITDEYEQGAGDPLARIVEVTLSSDSGCWSGRGWAIRARFVVTVDDWWQTYIDAVPGGVAVVSSPKTGEITRYVDAGRSIAAAVERALFARWGRVGWRTAANGGQPDDTKHAADELVALLDGGGEATPVTDRQPTLEAMRGLPGSGKTTYARAWVAEDPDNRRRVSRDDIRAEIRYGGDEVDEDEVTKIQLSRIAAALAVGADVVVDDTNCEHQHVQQLRQLAAESSASFEVRNFDLGVNESITRQAGRPADKQVPIDAIERMARHLETARLAEAALTALQDAGFPAGEPGESMVNIRRRYLADGEVVLAADSDTAPEVVDEAITALEAVGISGDWARLRDPAVGGTLLHRI